MLIGILKEIKIYEYCVGMIFVSVCELVECGYDVLVEMNVVVCLGFLDSDYEKFGVLIVLIFVEIFEWVDMVVKVKELLVEEVVVLC